MDIAETVPERDLAESKKSQNEPLLTTVSEEHLKRCLSEKMVARLTSIHKPEVCTRVYHQRVVTTSRGVEVGEPMVGEKRLEVVLLAVLAAVKRKKGVGLEALDELLYNAVYSEAHPPGYKADVLSQAQRAAAKHFSVFFPHLSALQQLLLLLYHRGGRFSTDLSFPNFSSEIDAMLDTITAPTDPPFHLLKWAGVFSLLTRALSCRMASTFVGVLRIETLPLETALSWLATPIGECLFWAKPIEVVIVNPGGGGGGGGGCSAEALSRVERLCKPEGLSFVLHDITTGMPNAKLYSKGGRGGGDGGGDVCPTQYATLLLPPLLRFVVTEVTIKGIGVVVHCTARPISQKQHNPNLEAWSAAETIKEAATVVT